MQRRPRFRRPIKPKEEPYRINEKIRATEIRIVGGNVETKVCSPKEALVLAEELGLDLVEISPDAKPPVCKIIDYKKFLFEKRKEKKR